MYLKVYVQSEMKLTLSFKWIFGIIYKSVNVNNNRIINCKGIKGIKERFTSDKKLRKK